MVGDFWVNELHSPGSRELLRMVATAALDHGAALSDSVLHRSRRTFVGLGQKVQASPLRTDIENKPGEGMGGLAVGDKQANRENELRNKLANLKKTS